MGSMTPLPQGCGYRYSDGNKRDRCCKRSRRSVVADDNYITIRTGNLEGRKFFDNLQKGIKYYLSVKTALILSFLLTKYL